MISCTEFIPAYSELFKFLEEKNGHEAVLDFWHYIADNYLTGLKNLAEEKGLQGCWEYWSAALNEEAADFTMEMNLEQGIFIIRMHHCPSKGRLLEFTHLEPFHDYCGHCRELYSRVLEPLGFEYFADTSDCDTASCKILILHKNT